jgi:phage tail-like protein
VASVANSNGTEVTPPLRASHCFKVQIQNSTIGVFTTCTGLQVEYDVLEYAEGGHNAYVHKLRGVARYANLVLSRGVTTETGLLDWLFQVQQSSQRPTVTISLMDEKSTVVRAWTFGGALPVRWTGPTLAEENAQVATETLEIAHTGLVPQT